MAKTAVPSKKHATGTAYLPVADLATMAAPYNPRKIDRDDLDALKASLSKFGDVEPVVVNSRTKRLVGGHQRVRAAQELGLKMLSVTWVDLSEIDEKQLNVALNKISGRWDDMLLAPLLQELRSSGDPLGALGFTNDEVEAVIARASRASIPPDEFPNPEGDTRLVHKCPKCGFEFKGAKS